MQSSFAMEHHAGRAIRFSENVVADIREWTSTWGRRALDFGGRAGYHDFNQI